VSSVSVAGGQTTVYTNEDVPKQVRLLFRPFERWDYV